MSGPRHKLTLKEPPPAPLKAGYAARRSPTCRFIAQP